LSPVFVHLSLSPVFVHLFLWVIFPHARCIADSSASLDYAIGARYHLSRRQDSRLIIIRQQAHPAQEEVQYEAEADHLRHTKFVGLKDDKDPAKIVKET
jgi:hypothetical protein